MNRSGSAFCSVQRGPGAEVMVGEVLRGLEAERVSFAEKYDIDGVKAKYDDTAAISIKSSVSKMSYNDGRFVGSESGVSFMEASMDAR